MFHETHPTRDYLLTLDGRHPDETTQTVRWATTLTQARQYQQDLWENHPRTTIWERTSEVHYQPWKEKQ